MNKFVRVLISILCLFAALFCYANSSVMGGSIFLVLGLGFEFSFWKGMVGAFKSHKRKRHDHV